MFKACSKCKQSKNISEFGKRTNTKDGLALKCKKCINSYCVGSSEKIKLRKKSYYNKNCNRLKKESIDRYRINAEKVKATLRARYLANPDKFKIKSKTYQKLNKKKISLTKAQYRLINHSKMKAKDLAYRKANPGKVNALAMKRYAAKLKRTPKWLTKENFREIQQLYLRSYKLTQETGILHEVDHIVPLQGKEVNGLHVPWNLQVITAKENNKKGNKFNG